MASHTAEWLAAGRLPGGDRIWIHILHYPGTIRWRWQITAYRTRYRPVANPFVPDDVEQHRLLLHDPTPVEALAAACLLGIAPGPRTAH